MAGSTDPQERRVHTNGIELAVFEWGREHAGRDAPILIAHATGFHARCYDALIAQLGERHVLAIDQRGHGRSEKTEIRHWDVFGQDLAGLVQQLGLRDIVGVGHSMGGHAMTEAAAACPQSFRRLVLIDPVIAAPGDYGEGGWVISGLGGEPHPTIRRKNRFASAQQMFERFQDRVPYSAFTPEALRGYCEYGLLPAPDGDGFVLACPPEIEASIYMTSRTNALIYQAIRALDIPVLIVRARQPPPDRQVMDFRSSPTWPGLVREFKHAREIHLPDCTHFVPMEDPKRVAGYVLEEPGA